jgi:ATP synthase F1 complex assembly factor 2
LYSTNAENLKSSILAFAMLDKQLDSSRAVHLSRLEEQHQIDVCGLVEGHHDVDENNVLVNVAAADLFE